MWQKNWLCLGFDVITIYDSSQLGIWCTLIYTIYFKAQRFHNKVIQQLATKIRKKGNGEKPTHLNVFALVAAFTSVVVPFLFTNTKLLLTAVNIYTYIHMQECICPSWNLQIYTSKQLSNLMMLFLLWLQYVHVASNMCSCRRSFKLVNIFIDFYYLGCNCIFGFRLVFVSLHLRFTHT